MISDLSRMMCSRMLSMFNVHDRSKWCAKPALATHSPYQGKEEAELHNLHSIEYPSIERNAFPIYHVGRMGQLSPPAANAILYLTYCCKSHLIILFR